MRRERSRRYIEVDNIEGIEVDNGAGPACTPAREPDSGRVRRDTVMLQPSDVEQRRIRTEEKLRELASTAATKRKSDCFHRNSRVVDSAPDETTFTMVSLDLQNQLLKFAKCTTCGSSDIAFKKGEREYGLAVKLTLSCSNCGDIASGWSSPRVSDDQTVNPFVVNILAVRAMQSTGNQQTALNDVFSVMNISNRGLHNKTWQNYVKKKLTPAAVRAAKEVMTESAQLVRQLYSVLNLRNVNNIAVSFDGSWMTRGHTSHIGVGAVVELFSGFVLDYVVLSNFCAGCERGPKKDDPVYAAWRASHLCQKNTDKKAGEVEVQAGLLLFERSLKNGLRYTTVLSDGDSYTFLALQEAYVYGYIKI
ncbi:hypothetical protein HPB49_011170 [Dermacentor silvarum]|uniref:Uncharacterized protein n=1 Tax=Dermacentor silvarum TaxID=543639 RepID=A0ACB8C355_DERSI|nr:hypothetical protein HPB49_011170 [Dermacentor silvarum]